MRVRAFFPGPRLRPGSEGSRVGIGDRREPQDGPRVVQDDVDGAVRSARHVTHAAGVLEDGFLVDHAVVFDREEADLLKREGAHEQSVLPAREEVAAVEVDAAHGDGGTPEQDRLFEAGLSLELRDGGSVVVPAVCDCRPAVVDPCPYEVDFVPAHGPVLALPQGARNRMNGQALRVALAKAEDGREGAFRLQEGVVSGNPAVPVDAVNFPAGPGPNPARAGVCPGRQPESRDSRPDRMQCGSRSGTGFGHRSRAVLRI